MLSRHLSSAIFSKVTALGIAPMGEITYRFQDTIKQRLINNAGELSLTPLNNGFIGEISCDSFREALTNDLYFGFNRCFEQERNIKLLLNSSAQPAWIIVTAYYASFFACNEIAKLLGSFIINFSKSEFLDLIGNSVGTIPLNPDDIQDNNSYQVKISHSSTHGYVQLTFLKGSPKPHLIAWTNICSVVRREVGDNDQTRLHRNLFIDICDSEEDRWRLPSAIRNEWNYTKASYYGDPGTRVAQKFLQIVRDSQSTMRWASSIHLAPHEENVIGSLSFVYHSLFDTLRIVKDRFLSD